MRDVWKCSAYNYNERVFNDSGTHVQDMTYALTGYTITEMDLQVTLTSQTDVYQLIDFLANSVHCFYN